MKWGDSNWAQASSVNVGWSSGNPRYIRITSRDFSLRLWAFSMLRGRI